MKASKRPNADPNRPYSARTYPVVDCAVLTAENAFKDRWQLLFELPTLWEDLIAPGAKTVSVANLGFRALSRYECLVEGTLVHRNRRWRVKVLLKLITDSIDNEPLGPWLEALVEKYKGKHGGLNGDEFKGVLQIHASHFKIQNGRIETWHAQLRRCLEARRVQTHKLDLLDASAETVVHRARMRRTAQQKYGFHAEIQQASGTTSMSSECGTADHDGRRGGPWKLFVRDETFGLTGTKPDLAKVAEK